ncbi:copper transporter [Allosaccharopolyspora coralli]|uniref:Copper transporter n=1 Tax=Allosaccharopolyspora coralli TaxID=2665642 RepID=A0A5Q3Q9P8_9PSEU|nr:copper transporter [Allosaccharopolyspora coralli]QGK70580.1 copper transporter [Allosaccharopolyspora coralli]
MISVRYHIVSLAAVFLALTVGILLGSTSVSERLLTTVGGQRDALGQEVEQLRSERDALRGQLAAAEQFGTSVAPTAVRDQLRSRTITLVTTGDAPDEQREAVKRTLADAGARVTGEVQLTDGFADPNRADELRRVVTQLLPAGVQLPPASDPGTLAGGLLGSLTLAGSGNAGAQPSPEERAAALGGLTEGGFVRVAQDIEPAELAVVVTGSGQSGDQDRAATIARFATEMDRAGQGAVLAGSRAAAESRGPIGVVRADSTMASALSTVDNVGSAPGRVATVLALREQTEGRSGQYGVAEGAQGPSPDVRG